MTSVIRRSIVLLAVLFLVVAGSSSGARASEGANCHPWQLTSVPNHGEEVAGLDGLSSTDIWAVMSATYTPHPLNIAHWDGTSWTSSPIAARDGDLFSVTAIGPDDAWAVGSSGDSHTLALHWDGSVWSSVPVPSPAGDYDILYDVSATSSTDVWAVGVTELKGFIVHWDGIRWSVVPRPQSPGNRSYYAVLALARDNVWAAGAWSTSSGFAVFIEHWDGAKWTDVPIPNRLQGDFLQDLGASGPDDVWAVGSNGSNSYGSLIYHWDGGAWTRMSQVPYALTGSLRGVSVLGPDDVWVAGFKGSGGPPVTAHWNGSRWTMIGLANKAAGWLNTIKAFGPDDVWAGGYGLSTSAITARFVACP